MSIFHGAEVRAVAIGEGVSMVEWVFEPRHKMNQVAVQRWNRGKIISEKFYHDSQFKGGVDK